LDIASARRARGGVESIGRRGRQIADDVDFTRARRRARAGARARLAGVATVVRRASDGRVGGRARR
jgi:hypothetical protein